MNLLDYFKRLYLAPGTQEFWDTYEYLAALCMLDYQKLLIDSYTTIQTEERTFMFCETSNLFGLRQLELVENIFEVYSDIYDIPEYLMAVRTMLDSMPNTVVAPRAVEKSPNLRYSIVYPRLGVVLYDNNEQYLASLNSEARRNCLKAIKQNYISTFQKADIERLAHFGANWCIHNFQGDARIRALRQFLYGLTYCHVTEAPIQVVTNNNMICSVATYQIRHDRIVLRSFCSNRSPYIGIATLLGAINYFGKSGHSILDPGYATHPGPNHYEKYKKLVCNSTIGQQVIPCVVAQTDTPEQLENFLIKPFILNSEVHV